MNTCVTLKILYVLALFMAGTDQVFAKEEVIKERKNIVSVFYPRYYFFEGENRDIHHRFNPPVGIQYTRLLSSEKQMALRFTYLYYGVGYQSLGYAPSGSVANRKLNFWSLYYLHPLVKKEKYICWLAAGGKHRSGSEMIYGGRAGNPRSRLISDFGMSPGIIFTKYLLPFNLTLSGEANYFLFPVTNGATYNMVNLSVSFGYRF